MRLFFLGTASGDSIGTKRVKSSLLVEEGETHLVLDMGAGANLRLEDMGLLSKPQAIFITHLHVDHFSGLIDHLVQRKIHGVSPPEVHGPPGVESILRTYREVGNSLEVNLREAEKPSANLGELKVWSVRGCHKVYEVGYVVESKERRILYTGDTSEPCEEVLEAAEVADLVVHEASCIEGCEGWGHTTVKGVLQHFPKKKLILTHIRTREEESVRELTRGKALVAYDGMEYDV